MTGKLAAIAFAARKRGVMTETMFAEITVAKGITGDARGHFPGRQVTLLFAADWQAACADLGRSLPWTTRRANLLIEHLDVPREKGAQIAIGEVLLEVTEETTPCNLMEKAAAGLKAALRPGWRGGVCCKVLRGGSIALGDEVTRVPR